MSEIITDDENKNDSTLHVNIEQWEPEELSAAKFNKSGIVYSTGVMSRDFDLLMYSVPSVIYEVAPHMIGIIEWGQQVNLLAMEIAKLESYKEEFLVADQSTKIPYGEFIKERTRIEENIRGAKQRLYNLSKAPPKCIKEYGNGTSAS